MDIGYNMNEKAILYSEDIRASLSSLKEAFEYTKKAASNEAYLENYKDAVEDLSRKLRKEQIIPASSMTDNKRAFLPTLSKSDVTNQAALFAV